jgi:hypothetical protein
MALMWIEGQARDAQRVRVAQGRDRWYNASMTIDRELYGKAYQAYRLAHDAEVEEHGRRTGEISSRDAWQRYSDLVDLCWRLAPRQSQYQRREHMAAWDRYYEAIQRLEAWRRTHGVCS